MLDIHALLSDKSEAQLNAALERVLVAHTVPVFGAANQVEQEGAALRALKTLGALPDSADEYTVATNLRITKTKARNLLYLDALRTLTSIQQIYDASCVRHPTRGNQGRRSHRFQGARPLLMNALRHRVRQFGFPSDGSFAGRIARLPQRALAALIKDFLPPPSASPWQPDCGAH